MEYKPARNEFHIVIPFIERFYDDGITITGYVDGDSVILDDAVQYFAVAEKLVMQGVVDFETCSSTAVFKIEILSG